LNTSLPTSVNTLRLQRKDSGEPFFHERAAQQQWKKRKLGHRDAQEFGLRVSFTRLFGA
jgi:hypothetical protein